MITKNCARCGQIFTTPKHAQKHCSNACSFQSILQHRRDGKVRDGKVEPIKKEPIPDLETIIEQVLCHLVTQSRFSSEHMKRLKVIEATIKYLSLKGKKGSKDDWGAGLNPIGEEKDNEKSDNGSSS